MKSLLLMKNILTQIKMKYGTNQNSLKNILDIDNFFGTELEYKVEEIKNMHQEIATKINKAKKWEALKNLKENLKKNN